MFWVKSFEIVPTYSTLESTFPEIDANHDYFILHANRCTMRVMLKGLSSSFFLGNTSDEIVSKGAEEFRYYSSSHLQQ